MSRSGITAQRTDDPATARQLVLQHGAAILSGGAPAEGESWVEYGVRRATAVLGTDGVQVVPQFEASTRPNARSLQERATRAPDDPFHTRLDVTPSQDLWLHNDGYAVGDQAPDQLFLLCQQPAPQGGENVLIDTLQLLEEIAAEDPELHGFLSGTDVDQSEPAFDVVHAPIMRTLSGGRIQVRRNPYQSPLPGTPAGDAALLARWAERCEQASRTAPGNLLRAGDVACIDNYRVLHGRRQYVGDERIAHSIWGWSHDAVDVLPLGRELVF